MTMVHINDFIMGPSRWRKMSGPLAFMTALLVGFFGLLLTAIGGSLLVQGDSQRLAALLSLGSGLAALTNVVVGVTAFLRANNGPT